jgi:opacity protein-like surface antigen
MKIKSLLVPAVLFVSLAAASPALAQNRSESWEFGPYLVGNDFDSALEIEDDWGAGFRFGYNFVPMHELEFSFDETDTQDNVFHDIDVRVGQFQVNYLFNFVFDRHQKVIPYFTAGLGAFRLEVHEPGFGSDEETDPSFNMGGGVRFFFDKKFNLRLDLRWVSFEGDNVVLNNIGFTNSQFSVGVGWVLGGR